MRFTPALMAMTFMAALAGGSCGGGSGGGPSGPSATLTGSVRGTVRDDLGGAVSGASVQLSATGKTTRSTTSQSDGSFTFANVDAGVWLVTVVAPSGFAGGSSPVVTVTANQEATVAAIVLTKLPAGTVPTAAEVIMYQSAFMPNNTTIRAGGTVRWRNTDPEAHTATGSGFDTGTLLTNASSTQTFPNPGTFNYVCSLHAGMTGRVTVVQ